MNPVGVSADSQRVRQCIGHLALADPQAANRIAAHLAAADPATCAPHLDRVVDAVIEALTVETGFGRTLADGAGRLLANAPPDGLGHYLDRVQTAAANGPTLAGLMAQHLVPVISCGDPHLADQFERVSQIMLQKGVYTLKAPLEVLSALVESDQMACAHAFLDLLAGAYSGATSYNRTVYLTHLLPQAVRAFSPARRLWQIRGLTRIIGEHEGLVDHYLAGMAAGLHLLSEAALDTFLDRAIQHYRKDPNGGARWLSLASHTARSVCTDLQVAVPLATVRSSLERYLRLRTGLMVAIRASNPFDACHPGMPLVHSDGQAVYLPEEIDLRTQRSDNVDLAKLLVKLEAGLLEFGTFDLDLDKVVDNTGAASPEHTAGATETGSELKRFVQMFEHPQVALDLFTLFEHARIARRVARSYPGLARRLGVALAQPGRHTRHVGGTLYPLYRHLVMQADLNTAPALRRFAEDMATRFDQVTADGHDTAETSARLAMSAYRPLIRLTIAGDVSGYESLNLPFGRQFDPAAFGPFHSAYDRLAGEIRTALNHRGVRVYRSDLRDILIRQQGQVSAADIHGLTQQRQPGRIDGGAADISQSELEALICRHGAGPQPRDQDGANAFRYREWDWCMGDYLPDHVRVAERRLPEADSGFYRQTLARSHGMVNQIRHAFELLRPEEMTILRQWPEGDAFDYRALLDYAVDKKAGLIPSERLFIKRMKRLRDVATVLLVDMSRSTANTGDERGSRVMDVEKQAIVLLCEALQVVGDRFAVSGFSGTGALGVDYYRIKDLEEPFDAAVENRIGAMAPQRSTRMGAAVRHATARLRPVQALVILIIILSDGYPNDLGYKGPYAVEDTRRAVMEARAAGVHVKAITVTANDNRQLDRLYGKHHHTLIGNIRDLPERLVRVYSALTRH
jgi:Mg-chelatase subunit ChlD